MKTVIKLVIAALVLNAVVRSGQVAWTYFQLRDATAEMITFGAKVTMAELRGQIVAKAAELNVPLRGEDVIIKREQRVKTIVQADYTQPVELFPRYVYPMKLSFVVDGFLAVGNLPDEPPER